MFGVKFEDWIGIKNHISIGNYYTYRLVVIILCATLYRQYDFG